ncbi:MAG: hypothetical protein WAU89_24090 [Candidatus Acidiferrales bacterium]
MFWFFKLGLLTCVFYVGLTIVLDAAIVGLAHLVGVGFRIDGPGLALGAKYGVIFGALWLISFSAAWWIVYIGLKAN